MDTEALKGQLFAELREAYQARNQAEIEALAGLTNNVIINDYHSLMKCIIEVVGIHSQKQTLAILESVASVMATQINNN